MKLRAIESPTWALIVPAVIGAAYIALYLPAAVEVRNGSPATAIIAAAEERRADLIIIASHIPDIYNYFIGATADRVVRHAKCSVLVDR